MNCAASLWSQNRVPDGCGARSTTGKMSGPTNIEMGR
jgi:hypothetical protein